MSWHYNIDIIGACNLRCPSCPVGNSTEARRPKGVMSLEIFEAIVKKIKRENSKVRSVALYNWTEPLLHPQIGKIIEIAHRHGLKATLSSNLNNINNLESALKANVDSLRISLSGYSQEFYGRTHVGGDVGKVKANMRTLRNLIDRHKVATKVNLLYHCYIDNVGEQFDNMKAFCDELRIEFVPVWAYMMPLEKCLEHYERGLTGEDAKLHDLLAVRLDEMRDISLRHRSSDCTLRSQQTTINCDGSVALCCSVYDLEHSIAPNFLDETHVELQRRKYSHPLCATCMEHGLHDTAIYSGVEDWHVVAAGRIEGGRVPNGIHGSKHSVLKKIKRSLRSMLKWSGVRD